eukprot:6763416-Pyramimonas_sp.AAC.1
MLRLGYTSRARKIGKKRESRRTGKARDKGSMAGFRPDVKVRVKVRARRGPLTYASVLGCFQISESSRFTVPRGGKFPWEKGTLVTDEYHNQLFESF